MTPRAASNPAELTASSSLISPVLQGAFVAMVDLHLVHISAADGRATYLLRKWQVSRYRQMTAGGTVVRRIRPGIGTCALLWHCLTRSACGLPLPSQSGPELRKRGSHSATYGPPA